MLKILLIIILLLPSIAYAYDEDQSKGVILAYHRIDEPEHTDSSLSFEKFVEHVQEIKQGEYNVVPLSELIKLLKNKANLPEKTIALTFEGGFRSIYARAIPLLIENDLPFTIFIASESTKIPNHLNWDDLSKISKYEGASFGILPAEYKHITDLPKTEITRLINQSRKAIKENIGKETTLLSYPFGEISSELKEISLTQGFDAAFGLHSGPAHSKSDFLVLPRFTMTESYADIDRFQMITNTIPLVTKDEEPQNWKTSSAVQQIGFTALNQSEDTLKTLSCHISGQNKPKIEILANRVEIIPETPIIDERTRLNCTLPVIGKDQKQWRWLGILLH